MSEIKTHKALVVWQKSMDFVVDIYRVAQSMPHKEKSGLISQMRRAAVSIPSTIAEGAARISKKEFVRFLTIPLGSGSEVETR